MRDGVVETDVAGVGVESPYALRLNNEEREGVPDAVFYVGLNRVIANEGRIGTGLVRATARVR